MVNNNNNNDNDNNNNTVSVKFVWLKLTEMAVRKVPGPQEARLRHITRDVTCMSQLPPQPAQVLALEFSPWPCQSSSRAYCTEVLTTPVSRTFLTWALEDQAVNNMKIT